MRASLFLIATTWLISGCCTPYALQQTAIEKFSLDGHDPVLQKRWPDEIWRNSLWKSVSFPAYEEQPDDIDKFTTASSWVPAVAVAHNLLVTCDASGAWKIVGNPTSASEMHTSNYWRVQFGHVAAQDKSTFVPYVTERSTAIDLNGAHPVGVTAGNGCDPEIKRNFGKINAVRASLESEQHCDEGEMVLVSLIVAPLYLLNPFNWFR